MTTIVYANNEMAWDSRVTAGGDIISDTAQKRYVHGGRTFWCSGTVGDFEEFAQSFPSRKCKRELNVHCFVLEDGKLFTTGTDAGEIWTSPVLGPRALGSGADHAITAIDCGLTPAQAIKMAAKRDSHTGGKVRTQKL